MKVLRYSAPRHAEIVTVPDPAPQSGEFVTRSLFCDISAGTEMGFYRGTAPQLNTVNNAQGNFDDHANAMTYPMQSNNPGTWWMGYSNVSEVSAVGSGVTEVKVGDVIYAQKPHKTVQIFSANEPWWKVPAGIDYRNASLTALTGIALNGILDSGIRLKENVVVFGCGMLGTLVAALAKKSGARVIAVDALPQRLEGASKAGADEVIDLTKSADVATEVYALTENRGADLVIEVSGNIKALSTAMRAVACCGRVVCLSFYADGAPALNLGREFHHKHINLISSQICNLNPALLKWWNDDRRTRTALALTQELNVKQFVTHYVGFDVLPATLEMIDKHSSECGAVCIDYSK